MNFLENLKKYENFIHRLNTVCGKYCEQHSDLVSEIAQLRTQLSDSNTVSIISVFDSPLESAADLQVSKALYRKIAMLTHPDRPNGDAVLFAYAHALYLSADRISLTHLYEALLKNDLSDYSTWMNQKIQALYEVAKSKPSYQILLADFAKDYEKADKLCVKFLIKSIQLLKSRK